MKILVVNLDRRKDRWDDFCKQAEKSKLIKKNHIRYRAVDGSLLSDSDMQGIITPTAYQHIKNNKPTQGLYFSSGALGLAKTYFDILSNCNDITLILEDDIIIHSDLDNQLFKSLEDLPDDWDILYIGWYKSAHLKIDILTANIGKISGQINGTQGWIINPKSCKKILEIFPLLYQIDTEIYRHKNLNKYCTVEPIISRSGSYSDIQN